MAVDIRPHIDTILMEEARVQNLDPTMTIEKLFHRNRRGFANTMVRLQISLGPLMPSCICDEGVEVLRTFTIENFVWAVAKHCE